MTPRYELKAVRLNGEVYPALVDHADKGSMPYIFYAKDKPGYAELTRLMAEYQGHQFIGLTPRDVLHLPHYLSDQTVDRIRKANAGEDAAPRAVIVRVSDVPAKPKLTK